MTARVIILPLIQKLLYSIYLDPRLTLNQHDVGLHWCLN